MTSIPSNYSDSYTDAGFWKKVGGVFRKAGEEVLEKAITAYFVLTDSNTPFWAKSVLAGAVGYFISPIDVIPDAIPVVGYTDDVAVLVGALATVAAHIKPEHVAAAKEKIQRWFA